MRGWRWRLLMQCPYGEADADRGDDLSQPEHQEELPEEASELHGAALAGHEQVALADDRLDARPPIGAGFEFVANAVDMHVDTAVEAGQGPTDGLFGQLCLAYGMARMAREHFEQAEFCAGEFELPAIVLGTPLTRPDCQGADRDGLAGLRLATFEALQDGAQAGRQLPRATGLRYIVIRTVFEAGNPVSIVPPRRQHDDRDRT